MSHTYVQQLMHVVWSTKGQHLYIPQAVGSELCAYLSAAISDLHGKLYFAAAHTDHVHCLLSLPPTQSTSDMMRSIKASSSQWIKTKDGINKSFAWETGFAAVSVQVDRIDSVCSYIKGDEARHASVSYAEELASLLNLQGISYDNRYYLQNSHSNLLVHMIWSTKDRVPLLDKSIRPALYEQMCKTAREIECTVHAVGGIEDHVHLLLEVSRKMPLSDVVRETKVRATHWLLNKTRAGDGFEWQSGYGAFTISLPAVPAVRAYILGQEEHHKASNSKSEWGDFVLRSGVF